MKRKNISYDFKIIRSNEAGLADFKGGWTSCVETEDGFFKVTVTKEQYEQMVGAEYDP